MMNLIKAKLPVKSTKTVEKVKVIRPARFENGDMIPPVTRVETVDVDIWVVETYGYGDPENHEFASEESAMNYYKGF